MDIKDYIHLYINSEALYRLRYVDSEDGQWSVWLTITPTRLAQLDDLSIEKVEYALRRLEDMTEDENLKICQMKNDVYTDIDDVQFSGHAFYFTHRYGIRAKRFKRAFSIRELNSDQFHYLLKQGFDLFGLIAAGLAIDSKTLNQREV